ncbi:MAG: O-antigen ligase family protein [Verrucomicrobia bacterium]|nr:O-antigen ligase family protein [Verrucomicrobiota bacterium]
MKACKFLLALLFLTLPFQPRLHKPFSSLSKALIPADLSLPSYFSTKLSFYFSDLLLIAFITFFLWRSWKEVLIRGPVKYLTLLGVVSLLSVMTSSTGHYLLQYERALHLFLFFALFSSIVAYFRQNPLSRKWFAALIIPALFQCFLGMAQYFAQGRMGLKWLGEENTSKFAFPVSSGKRWLFDSWLGKESDAGFLFRAHGTFSHPNILGGFLVCTLLLTFYLTLTSEKKGMRLCLYGAALLQFFTLCITFSRAAFLALALGSALWLYLAVKKRLVPRKRLLVLAATFFFAASSCLVLFFAQFYSRGGIVNYNAITAHADTERVLYQKLAWEMFKENPLLGVGFNNYQLYIPADQPQLFAKVHNIYLLLLAETGLLGFGAFLLFLGSIFRRLYPIEWDMRTATLFSILIGFLFIGGCDFYFLQTQQGRLLFFLFLALLYASGEKCSSQIPHRSSILVRDETM